MYVHSGYYYNLNRTYLYNRLRQLERILYVCSTVASLKKNNEWIKHYLKHIDETDL